MSERASGGAQEEHNTKRPVQNREKGKREGREGGSKEGETERVPRRIGIGGETHATV